MTDTYLLYRDDSRDRHRSYYFEQDIIKDLNLDPILSVMARNDELVYERCMRVMMTPVSDPKDISYRHEVIMGFSSDRELLDELFVIGTDHLGVLKKYKENMKLYRARSHRSIAENIERLTYLKEALKSLIAIRDALDRRESTLKAEGLTSLLKRLSGENLDELSNKLSELFAFVRGGEFDYTFHVGGGLKLDRVYISDVREVVFRPERRSGGLFRSFADTLKRNVMSTENNTELKGDIGTLQEAALEKVMKLFTPFLDDTVRFFEHFAEDICFYTGVVRLYERMRELGFNVCFPVALEIGEHDFEIEGLYDLSMALAWRKKPVPNDLSLKGVYTTLITGANQGGKSTFLRSLGIAQVLMQCGCIVPADGFSSPIFMKIFTHFTRRENERLTEGRLAEELSRMQRMTAVADENSMFLLNESFASTTEKEGAVIAGDILRAFHEKGITTFMVTHLYMMAREMYDSHWKDEGNEYCFLKAERLPEGMRTFRMVFGEPEATSYGMELFEELLGK